MLLYPKQLSDGPESFFHFVMAESPDDAVARARDAMRKELSDWGCCIAAFDLPDSDIPVLLVLRGHRRSLAISEMYT